MFAPKSFHSRSNAVSNTAAPLLQRRPELPPLQSGQHAIDSSSMTEAITPMTPWDFGLIPLHPRSQTGPAQAPLVGGPSLAIMQCKSAVGQADDPLEHEADRVAEQVLSMPAAVLPSATMQVSPKCAACAADKGGETDGAGDDQVAKVKAVLRSSGRPLDAATRSYFEPRFGRDFGDVRVHSDSSASDSAREMNARAYTVGRHIVFGAGQLAQGTRAGSRLLAHELTHVVQQGALGTSMLQRDKEDKAGAQGSGAAPAHTFVNCSSAQQELVKTGIDAAVDLAARAVAALERPIQYSYEFSAMIAHFGKLGTDQKNAIISRYKQVQAKLSSDTYTCSDTRKPAKKGTHFCAKGDTPGTNIVFYADFGNELCPVGPVMLHEAIHNTGAGLDMDVHDSGYPPSNSEENPFSYEHFAVSVAGGYKLPQELKPSHKPASPKG